MSWQDIEIPSPESLNIKLNIYKEQHNEYIKDMRLKFDKVFETIRCNIMKMIKNRLDKCIDSHKSPKHIIIFCYEIRLPKENCDDFKIKPPNSNIPSITAKIDSIDLLKLYYECFPEKFIQKNDLLIYDHIMEPIIHNIQKRKFMTIKNIYHGSLGYCISWN